ncbi:hypothetical protein ABIE27_003432 [Paenibacillus sp. 4624]|jgi:hypothetical protein|uniref:hypothetical protein n=1 Tax=Paenibacillus TaxID=44249 RepID=UPI0018641F86|nr:hypothetical protein [Paenibacillus amylolyticus]
MIFRISNFGYIYNGLKEIDPDLHHFCLTAELETIYKRLAQRGDEFGGWQYQQAPKCVEAFKEAAFETRIATDHLATDEVIDIILHNLKG